MRDSQALTVLLDAGCAPLAEWPTRYPGYQAIGYMCSYVPVEILHAAGLTPVRLRGTGQSMPGVNRHLQSFTCALCRSTLEQSISGELDFVAGFAFAHTCDTMQAAADIWSATARPRQFVDVVVQPALLASGAPRAYLIAELSRFRARLASFLGYGTGDDSLRTSIGLYDETRRLVQALGKVRDGLGALQFHRVLDAAQIMPPERLNPLLADLLDDLDGVAPRERGPRLYLWGAVVDESRLWSLLDELGAVVAGDDLCSGSRHFHDAVGTDGDPVPALAEFFLRRTPCPSKLNPSHQPARFLLDRLRATMADGIVFILEKFCEPHAFDYALVLPELDRLGVPHLLLEMEQTPSLEALRTRLQAFVEML